MPETSPASDTATSLSLLERVRASDPDAWSRLVRIYGPLVSAWLRAGGLDDATVADVSQEVWHAAALAMPRFRRDPEAGFLRGWIWTIARNKANDHHRARRGEPAAAGGTDAHRRIEALPETEPKDDSGVADHQLLHRALEQIRPDFEESTWRAFWRMTVDSQSAADIGAELGLAPNAVHQAKFRVLRRLREEMAGLVEA